MTITANTETQESGATTTYTKWVLALFFAAIFIPGSFYVGIRMTPYRLYLMVMAIPMIMRASKDPTLRITAADVLIILLLSWQSLSILVNHRTSELVFAGSSFGERLLGYMLGRVFIRSPSDFRFFFKCFLAMLLATLPFALVESLTRQRLLGNLAGHVLLQPDEPGAPVRFGLMRVRGSFETFLVFGAFCAIGFANVFYVYLEKFPRSILYSGFVAFMTALAISTSSLLVIFLQTILIIYNFIFRWLKHRWIILAMLSVVPLLFAKTIITYIIRSVMFSRYSGDARSLHFEFGVKEIYQHPIFGVGLNHWDNAYWLSQAVDNFWLASTLQSGIPSAVFAGCFFATHYIAIATEKNLSNDEKVLRTGYLISFISIVLGFFAINFYAASLVFFLLYCGAGAMFYNSSRVEVGRPRIAARGRPRTMRSRLARPAGAQSRTLH